MKERGTSSNDVEDDGRILLKPRNGMSDHDVQVDLARQLLDIPPDFDKMARHYVRYFDQLPEEIHKRLQQIALDPSPYDFDMLTELAAKFLSDGGALPEWLAPFAADVLLGKAKRTGCKKPEKRPNLARDHARWRAVNVIAQRYDLPRYANNAEVDTPITAAAIVAEAAGLGAEAIAKTYKDFEKNKKLFLKLLGNPAG